MHFTLYTFFFQRVLMGQSMSVINPVMQTGDKFLASGNTHIALNFYREAIFLFPGSAICHIREGQSLLSLVSFDGTTYTI